MKESKFIWMDGELVAWKDAQVHVLTHALHYGTGVFEGIRCYATKQGPAVFRLKEHVDRLFGSAHILGIKVPFSKEMITQACRDIITKNKLPSAYIRPIIYLGYGQMGLNPVGCTVNVAIAAWEWGTYLGEDGVANGIRVKTSSFTRHHVNINMTRAKVCGAYVNSVLAKHEAVSNGYDEAMVLDVDGYVAEGSGENIFIVRDGILTTPVFTSFLPGITRQSVMVLAKEHGIPTAEARLTRDDVYLADEMFLTGTAAELTPVREVDGRTIGTGKPGPVTKQLQAAFSKVIAGEDAEHATWLAPVR
ncbi:branched chain amino acid aminotransferase [Candidatus Woesearchaeota archaeon CG1_02_57_44]|nr:MAG: branched chain amino acid aminotransferase [Candidatus Woesearchaeota archaeon CG1_02_57_44]